MTPSTTTQRVPAHTSEPINRRILIDTECRIRYYAAHPEGIDTRLRELDAEWDIERVLEANASCLALSGVLMGLLGKRKCLLLSAAVLAFLCQHAIEGWCPPLPLLRRLGVRTQSEIAYERYALKLLRGDLSGGAERGKEAVDLVLDAVGPERD